VINASPQQVYQEIISFRSFNKWSPWAKMDPNARYEFSGPESGVGAMMSWNGEETGTGSQKIIEVRENEQVKTEMYFGGFDKPSYAEFMLTPEGSGTKVTWSYDGDMEGLYKFFGLMMDGMLGKQYEEGLASFKEMVESTPAAAPVPADSAVAK
jgi:hypothetical protein